METTVSVFRGPDPHRAGQIRRRLADVGIPCVLEAVSLPVRGRLTWVRVDVRVATPCLARAREVLRLTEPEPVLAVA